MNPGREELLFELALEKAAAERLAFLDRACQGNVELRHRVEALLLAHDATANPLATRADTQPGGSLPLEGGTGWERGGAEERAGELLGRYKLVEKLGEGGFGSVWLAEQREPVRRKVALKIIKLGMDTRQVVARFEAERQALALMDHPNIAKVLDAGSTETGRPYFVMELVRGIPITRFCDENRLPTRERLELFMKVCQAIQHAHQKGIIHRDIKPSNVLVTLHDGVPVPKVIDFGIAKATQGELTDKTIHTQFQQFIGTPAYMSPEQAEMSGLDIDTRSDLYSLGVLLYELLTGLTPFDGRELLSKGIDAMRQTIREVEPPRPSTKVAELEGAERTTTAQRRAVEEGKLLNQLRGDLDWIVMKCLEKDRTRRYETANGLVADIRRHLGNEPVSARPPSAGYRLQKAWRRNRLLFIAGGAVWVALVSGLGVATLGLREAVTERNAALLARAGEERQRLEAQRAQSNEISIRREAQVQAAAERRRAYDSEINLAQQSVQASHFGRAWELLNRQRPAPGQADLRGWEWRFLWLLCQSDAAASIPVSTNGIMALAVSDNGRWIAAAEHLDGRITVWNRERRSLAGVPAVSSPGKALAFQPGTSMLVHTAQEPDGKPGIALWDAESQRSIRRIPLGGDCLGVSFSADGQWMAVAEAAPALRIGIWRVGDGVRTLAVPASFPDSAVAVHNPPVVVAPDGTFLVCQTRQEGGPPREVQLHELPSGRIRWKREILGEQVSALAVSADGKTVASAGCFTDSPVQLWETATGREKARLTGHRAYVSSLMFSPDGLTLSAACADQTVRVWPLDSDRPPRALLGHRNEVWSLARPSDGRFLVSGSKDGELMIWEESGNAERPRGRSDCPISEVTDWTFSREGASVFAISRDREVFEWTWSSSKDIRPLLSLPSAMGLCVSPDGAFLAIGSTNGTLMHWDVRKGTPSKSLRSSGSPVIPVGYSASGDRLLVVDLGRHVLVEFEVATAEVSRSWQTGPWILSYPGARNLRLSVDRRWCAAVGLGGELMVINLETGEGATHQLPFRSVDSVAFSPDTRLLAVTSTLGLTRIMRRESLAEVVTLHGHLLGHHSAIFSRDGTRLATGSGGGDAIKLWDVEGGQELITLSATGSHLCRTEFSPDGSALGGLSASGNLHVWQAPSWQEIEAKESKARPEGSRP